MPHLRLCRPTERDSHDPLPFPDVSAFARRDEPRPADLRLSERIDRAFDAVQADLDELNDEVSRTLHLPGTDDWPPSAA